MSHLATPRLVTRSNISDAAVRKCVLSCVAHLRHTARLAELAARGAEPTDGAEHVVGVLADLRAELRLLRRALRE